MADWETEQLAERIYFRMRNTVSFTKLGIGNDDDEMQHHQAELYQGEVRDGVQRMQEHGLSTMPLPGSHAIIMHHGGQRSLGTVVGTEDPRYRPRGLKPGETHGYMIDGADKKGENGTLRSLWKGVLGWTHSLFGKVINIGTEADTETIVITSKTKITIKAPTIVLDGLVLLGGEDATRWASAEGTVDSAGDTDVSNLATKVKLK